MATDPGAEQAGCKRVRQNEHFSDPRTVPKLPREAKEKPPGKFRLG